MAMSKGVQLQVSIEVSRWQKAGKGESSPGDVRNDTAGADVGICTPCKGQAKEVGQHEREIR
jgi:hypothetical protein